MHIIDHVITNRNSNLSNDTEELIKCLQWGANDEKFLKTCVRSSLVIKIWVLNYLFYSNSIGIFDINEVVVLHFNL